MYLLKFNNQHSGFSLVELLIAMVLGLVLSAGAIQIFVNNGSVYRMENELSRMQENGRFIVNSMVEDIRMAGYNGCSSRSITKITSIANDPFPISNGTPTEPFNGTEYIQGFESGLNIHAGLNIAGALPGSDVLSVQRASSCGAQLTNIFPAAGNIVVAANNCGFEDNQVVLVTDCRNADIFQISSVTPNAGDQTIAHATGVNRNGGILDSGSTYNTDASVYRYIANSYFIANDANGQPALFRSSWLPNGNNALEAGLPTAGGDFNTQILAQGVQDMQILYGEDTGGDSSADQYLTADAVGDWDDVRSVRISLLLQSLNDNITQGPRQITFNGALVNDVNDAASDRRMRTIYTTTVTLRNRLP